MADSLNGAIIERVQRLRSYIHELRDLQDEVTFEVYLQDLAVMVPEVSDSHVTHG